MDNGWLKLYRQMRRWAWYKDVKTKAVFLDLLLSANTKEANFKGTPVHRGELITSISHLAENNGLTVQEVRTALKKLQKTGEITVISTNQFSSVKVNNFEAFQSDEQQEQQASNTRATSEQQAPNNNIRIKNIYTSSSIIGEDGKKSDDDWNRDISSTDIAQHLKSLGEGWRESAMMALRIGKDDQALDSLIDDYQSNCISSGKDSVKAYDIQRHFTNYARKALQARKEETKRNNKSTENSANKYADNIEGKEYKGW